MTYEIQKQNEKSLNEMVEIFQQALSEDLRTEFKISWRIISADVPNNLGQNPNPERPDFRKISLEVIGVPKDTAAILKKPDQFD